MILVYSVVGVVCQKKKKTNLDGYKVTEVLWGQKAIGCCNSNPIENWEKLVKKIPFGHYMGG